MPDPGVGPYRYVATAGGEHAPWYVMPFDKHGRCRAPRTRGHLIDTISSGQFSDVFLFSHGWNNDWDTATDRYRDFMDGFTTMRTEHALDVRPGYKPLLVGIIWPGTALVMPWEAAPRFAGGAPVHEPTDDRSGDAQRMIDEIADELPDDAVPRFYELMDQDEGLDRSDALELAEMLLEFGSDEVLPDGGTPGCRGSRTRRGARPRWHIRHGRPRKPCSTTPSSAQWMLRHPVRTQPAFSTASTRAR